MSQDQGSMQAYEITDNRHQSAIWQSCEIIISYLLLETDCCYHEVRQQSEIYSYCLLILYVWIRINSVTRVSVRLVIAEYIRALLPDKYNIVIHKRIRGTSMHSTPLGEWPWFWKPVLRGQTSCSVRCVCNSRKTFCRKSKI